MPYTHYLVIRRTVKDEAGEAEMYAEVTEKLGEDYTVLDGDFTPIAAEVTP